MEMIKSVPGLLLMMLCVIFGNQGCKNDTAVEAESSRLPALTDSIPYAGLGRGRLAFERIGPFNNNYSGVYVLDIDQQRAWGAGSGVLFGPAISPDGLQIAYTTYTSPQTAYDVCIMNVDGTNRQRISDVVGQERSPSWAFDGKRIFFHVDLFNLVNPIAPLYSQSPVPQSTDRVLVFDFGKINPPAVYPPQGPVSAGPTGRLLVSAVGIRSMNGDGTDAKLLIPAPPEGKTLYSPAWSPNGQQFALLQISWNATSITAVAVIMYAADGTAPDTLVSLPASGTTEWSGENSYSLCWSPDGSQVGFTRPDGKDVGSHIYLIKKDHTGLTQVTFAEGVTDRSLSWSH